MTTKVIFTKRAGSYKAGTVKSFADAHAKIMILRGVAKLYENESPKEVLKPKKKKELVPVEAALVETPTNPDATFTETKAIVNGEDKHLEAGESEIIVPKDDEDTAAEDTADETEEEEKPKRGRGRPPRSQTYETKDVSAKE